MEVYILDSLLRRVDVVDKFVSMIWTERFASDGEFELLLHSSPESRGRFTKGTQLAINRSHRVMTVETLEDTTDEEGRALLKVRGPSLEDILRNRVAKDTMSNLTTEPRWVITDSPGDIMRTIFNDICVLGNLDPDDIIPFITTGNLFPPDTISETGTVVTVSLDPQSVYDAIKGLADLYDLGFRLTRNYDNSELFFNVYAGSDRTSNQVDFRPVIFSPVLDNMKNTVELSTIEKSKNVAYVFSPEGFEVVYASWVDPDDLSGFDRRVLIVNVDETIGGTAPEISEFLQQKGVEELSKHRAFSAFDGELITAYKDDPTLIPVNLLEDYNPEFDTTDLSAWYEGYVDNTWEAPGVMRITSLVNGFWYTGIVGTPGHVEEGQVLTWSQSIKAAPGSESMNYWPIINFWNSTGGLISQALGPTSNLGSTGYTRKWYRAVVPAGATRADVFVASNNGVIGQSFVVENVQLVEGYTAEYIPDYKPLVGPYLYGVDYNLGDLVEMRNVDNLVNQMRVTEQIFICDEQGERDYPTLSINQFIEPGVWLASEYNRPWDDWGLTEYWEDQP